MNEVQFSAVLGVTLHLSIQIALILRVLLRAHREPASRIAWVVVILALPVMGILAYILFGEVNIGRSRVERMREVLARMPAVSDAAGADAANLRADVPQRHAHLFRVGHSVNGFEPVGGNRARLLADSNATADGIRAKLLPTLMVYMLLGMLVALPYAVWVRRRL